MTVDPATAAPASYLLPAEQLPESIPVAEFFGRVDRLEVDIGCGKGRFLLARAQAHPHTSFLGIDRLSRRLMKVEARARRRGLQNVRLLLSEAGDAVRRLQPDSVSAFYLFFPDPWPKRRHHGRRLCTAVFLDDIHRALRAGGSIHVATDHIEYFEVMRSLFSKDPRFSELPALELTPEQQSDFEVLFLKLGAPIGRCSFEKRPTD